MKQRVQKVLAAAGVASRRNVEQMVREGRVAVNGQVMTRLPILVDPQSDQISIDGETIGIAPPRGSKRSREFSSDGPSPRIYLVMNKPRGVYSTNVAQGAQKRAIDLLPSDFPARVYPVGRLDADSKGLLLLTNDGELTNRLTHPRYGVPKTYRAVVDGFVHPRTVQELEKGIWLADKSGEGFKTGRSHIHIARRSRDKSVLEITIREGRNRQVRRMLARLGHKVRDLTRIRMGPLTLHGLAPGQFRPLTRREIEQLRKIGEVKPAPAKS